MSRTLLLGVLAFTAFHCYGALQSQMPETAELQLENDLQTQVQKNVSDIWAYIHHLRNAVTHLWELTRLRQHQEELETSMNKMEHLHEKKGHSHSHSSRTNNVDGDMNLMNFHSHHHRHHGASSRSRTVELPKISDFGLYDIALCQMEPNKALPDDQRQDITGTVTLWQKKSGDGPLNIHVSVRGFDVGGHQGDNETRRSVRHRHGFYIHTSGDLSNGCQSTGPHYNPTGVNHGGPQSLVRHVGDLGNIESDEHGVTDIVFSDYIASLRGQYSVLRKALVIHALEDDLGQGNDAESLKTGNAGARLACCVIEEVDQEIMNIANENSYDSTVRDSILLPPLLKSLSRQEPKPLVVTDVKEEYDYIVVGAGVAGAVVASRLSEESCVSVLLLEAGPMPSALLTEVPAFASGLLGSPLDWNFTSVPQKHGGNIMVNKQINLSAGKMLGGSGNHNSMAYVRSSPQNYDDWDANGAKGWSYKDVLPYFLKLENYTIPEYLYNGYHQINGPLTVEKMAYNPDILQYLTKAAENLGYEFLDPNGATMTGFMRTQMNTKNGQRCGTIKGYYMKAKNRPNLDTLLRATATKILIENNRAQGVQFHHESQTKIVKARREVIVSAGTYNSPKLLMLSGIGPKKELEKLNIPVIADLPVGKNLHGHSGVQYFYTVNPEIRSHDEKKKDYASIMEYFHKRTGPLAATGFLIYGFLKESGERLVHVDCPNVLIYIADKTSDLFKGIGVVPEIYKKYFEPYKNKAVFQCSPGNTQPKSRGTVTLKSTNPFDPPLLDPNYFAEKQDLEDTVIGLKICRNLLNTFEMQLVGATPLPGPLPGCENYTEGSDDYLRCYAKSMLVTMYHDCGTCKMGDPADHATVVDPELRVLNVTGLRVVDASVIPSVTSGNIGIPVTMIAEKASDIIKQSIKCGKKKRKNPQENLYL